MSKHEYGGKIDGAIAIPKRQAAVRGLSTEDKYYLKVNSKNGNVEVFARRPSGEITQIGTSRGTYDEIKIGDYDPQKNKFDYVDDAATDKEKEFFSDPQLADKYIEKPAKTILTKGLRSNNVVNNIEEATKEATKILDGENLTAIDPDAKTINDGLSTFIDTIEAKARTKYEPLYYPESIRQSKQDRIIFTLKKLVKVTYSADFDAKPFTREYSVADLEGSVTLPIQSGITDSNQVKWGPDELDEIKARAAASSLTLAKSRTGEELIGKLGNILTDAQKKIFDGSTPEFRQAIAVALAGEAVGAQGLLSRATGTVLNPNLELLFQGPQLRPFTFQFRLSPRGIEEAKMVKKIIRFFKQAMSVKTTKTNVFLSTPHVFDIKYQTIKGDELVDHTSLNKIKTCALLGCDVDYTPDGTYATFNDPEKTMTSYNLTLRFNELEPVFDGDYTDLDGDKLDSTMIGF